MTRNCLKYSTSACISFLKCYCYNVSYHCLKCLCSHHILLGHCHSVVKKQMDILLLLRFFQEKSSSSHQRTLLFLSFITLHSALLSFIPFLLSMCKISAEQKVIMYVLVGNISSKQKLA